MPKTFQHVGQKQEPEVFYSKSPPPLYACAIYLFICLFVPIKPWATHKITEVRETDSTSQHVDTFICDLSLAVPPNQVAHANPHSNIRKVSSPIQAVTKMTPSPVLRQAWWPDQSSLNSPMTFSKDLLLLPDDKWQEKLLPWINNSSNNSRTIIT